MKSGPAPLPAPRVNGSTDRLAQIADTLVIQLYLLFIERRECAPGQNGVRPRGQVHPASRLGARWGSAELLCSHECHGNDPRR
jgi:hypothetical protein